MVSVSSGFNGVGPLEQHRLARLAIGRPKLHIPGNVNLESRKFSVLEPSQRSPT